MDNKLPGSVLVVEVEPWTVFVVNNSIYWFTVFLVYSFPCLQFSFHTFSTDSVFRGDVSSVCVGHPVKDEMGRSAWDSWRLMMTIMNLQQTH